MRSFSFRSLIVATILATAAPLPLVSPATADTQAFRACMEKTLGKHVWKMLTFDLPGMIKNIDARAGCYSHLTREEAEELYNKNRGWYELFEPGGPLHPATPGYMQHI